MSTDTLAKSSDASLRVTTATQVKEELNFQGVPLESQLEDAAERYASQLASFEPSDLKATESRKVAVETIAADVQRDTVRQLDMLKQPLHKYGNDGQAGDVSQALLELKMKVEDLDPGKVDFQPGWFSRALGKVPGVGSPLKRYFTRFESAQTAIDAVMRSLRQGKEQLVRDNVTLSEDQKRMRELTEKLGRSVKLAQLVDQKLEAKANAETVPEKQQFLREEILFPLRQRVIDLQQQLAVAQQAVIASEILVRNNKELARGVDRTLNVTVNALQVAATVAIGLENQRVVLEKVQAVNDTTSDLIAGTASRLKTQGVQIQKQAGEATLKVDSLKQAFQDIRTALDDISTFRTQALPQMAGTILELDKLSADAAGVIEKMERGNQKSSEIVIGV